MAGALTFQRGLILLALTVGFVGTGPAAGQEGDPEGAAEPSGVALQYEIASPPRWGEGDGKGGTRDARVDVYPPPIYSLWYDIFYGCSKWVLRRSGGSTALPGDGHSGNVG